MLADLALILLAARMVGALFVRLRQPRMLAGLLIGPTVLGGRLGTLPDAGSRLPAGPGSGLTSALYPAQAFAFLNLLGLLALVLFTFLVGLEVQERMLTRRTRQIAVIALATAGAQTALGFELGALLSEPGVWRAVDTEGRPLASTPHALLLAAALASTALPVIARILQDGGWMAGTSAALGIGAAAALTRWCSCWVRPCWTTATQSAVVVVAIVTTAMTGPLLRLCLRREAAAGPDAAPA